MTSDADKDHANSDAAGHQNEVIEQLRVLYRDGGMYEKVSQMDHALQCAKQAADAGADELTVVAALLHDVGWMLSARKDTSVANKNIGVAKEKAENGSESLVFDENCLSKKLGILDEVRVNSTATPEQLQAQHDIIGGCYLRMMGFHEKVPHLVEGHVLAKRYLTAKDPEYYDKLSADSKRTLVFQGGPMDQKEMAAVEQDALFELGARMRQWDDLAKVEDLEVPDFDHYVPMVRRAMTKAPRDAARCSAEAFYIREGTTIVGVRSTQSERPECPKKVRTA